MGIRVSHVIPRTGKNAEVCALLQVKCNLAHGNSPVPAIFQSKKGPVAQSPLGSSHLLGQLGSHAGTLRFGVCGFLSLPVNKTQRWCNLNKNDPVMFCNLCLLPETSHKLSLVFLHSLLWVRSLHGDVASAIGKQAELASCGRTCLGTVTQPWRVQVEQMILQAKKDSEQRVRPGFLRTT